MKSAACVALYVCSAADNDHHVAHILCLPYCSLQVRAKLHQRWQHVLVDEGQDTNLCQFALINSITSPRASLFMVGDPDQVCVKGQGWHSDTFASAPSSLLSRLAAVTAESRLENRRSPAALMP